MSYLTMCFKKNHKNKKMCSKIACRNSLIIICLSLFMSACQNTLPQYKNGKTTFFDLKGYFKTEIERLKKDVKQVKKIVTVFILRGGILTSTHKK